MLSNLGIIDNDNKGTIFQDEGIVSILGLLWQPNEDVFCFKAALLNVNSSELVTKRRIYSDVAKFYDLIR